MRGVVFTMQKRCNLPRFKREAVIDRDSRRRLS